MLPDPSLRYPAPSFPLAPLPPRCPTVFCRSVVCLRPRPGVWGVSLRPHSNAIVQNPHTPHSILASLYFTPLASSLLIGAAREVVQPRWAPFGLPIDLTQPTVALRISGPSPSPPPQAAARWPNGFRCPPRGSCFAGGPPRPVATTLSCTVQCTYLFSQCTHKNVPA
eukprot:EG_transcript_14003